MWIIITQSWSGSTIFPLPWRILFFDWRLSSLVRGTLFFFLLCLFGISFCIFSWFWQNSIFVLCPLSWKSFGDLRFLLWFLRLNYFFPVKLVVFCRASQYKKTTFIFIYIEGISSSSKKISSLIVLSYDYERRLLKECFFWRDFWDYNTFVSWENIYQISWINISFFLFLASISS